MLPQGSHAAYNHDGADDADPLVLGHRAGQLLPDHDVHVILQDGEGKRGAETPAAVAE